MKIAIANDHSAVELKNIIKEHLESPQRAVITRYTVRRLAAQSLTAKQISELPSAEPASASL